MVAGDMVAYLAAVAATGAWAICTMILTVDSIALIAVTSDWNCTLSAAPNFAYELCLRNIDDRAIEGLDLSSWRMAFNGAEPVSPETLEGFIRRFSR